MLAAIIWLIGGIVLLVKGGSLLLEAAALKPGRFGPWMAVAVAMVIGGVKAKFLFSRSCRNNIARIAALSQPRIWQFYRPLFFLFLFLMVLIGSTLSRLAHGSYHFLLCIGTLDLTIAIALLGSFAVFCWRKPAF